MVRRHVLNDIHCVCSKNRFPPLTLTVDRLHPTYCEHLVPMLSLWYEWFDYQLPLVSYVLLWFASQLSFHRIRYIPLRSPGLIPFFSGFKLVSMCCINETIQSSVVSWLISVLIVPIEHGFSLFVPSVKWAIITKVMSTRTLTHPCTWQLKTIIWYELMWLD